MAVVLSLRRTPEVPDPKALSLDLLVLRTRSPQTNDTVHDIFHGAQLQMQCFRAVAPPPAVVGTAAPIAAASQARLFLLPCLFLARAHNSESQFADWNAQLNICLKFFSLLSQANFATKASAAALAGVAIGSRRWRQRACRLRNVPAPPRTQPHGRIACLFPPSDSHISPSDENVSLLALQSSELHHLLLEPGPGTTGSGGKESAKDRRSCVRHAGVFGRCA